MFRGGGDGIRVVCLERIRVRGRVLGNYDVMMFRGGGGIWWVLWGVVWG